MSFSGVSEELAMSEDESSSAASAEEFFSQFKDEFIANEDEKKLTLRLSGYDYNALKKSAAMSGKSMNALISDAIRYCYSGFVYSFAHDNEISKGADRYIFDLLGTEQILPFYENPAKSYKEMFSLLGINTYAQLEQAFLENLKIIVLRAQFLAAKRGSDYFKKLPVGIAVHYLIFAIVVQKNSVDEVINLANKCWLSFSEAINDMNSIRKHLGLELIPVN